MNDDPFDDWRHRYSQLTTRGGRRYVITGWTHWGGTTRPTLRAWRWWSPRDWARRPLHRWWERRYW